MYRFVFLLVFISINACSHIPKTIRNAPNENLQLSEIQNNFTAHQGKTVRWGGTLLNLKNTENQSTLQILSYPLTYNGRPDTLAEPEGRFIVKTTEFIDPGYYTKDSEITVAGLLTTQNEYLVDQKSLNLPVIEQPQIYRWRKYRQPYYGNYYGNYGNYGYCPSPFYASYRFGAFGYRGLYNRRSRFRW